MIYILEKVRYLIQVRRLTLTFDNGPTPGITERVLEALDHAGVRATFFLVGSQLEKPGRRPLAEEARALGHTLGNHTYTHGPPLGLQRRPGAAANEIRRMHDLMGDLVGEEPLFRPNGRGETGAHLLNEEAVATLQELRSTIVLWTSIPRDRSVQIDGPEVWVEDAKKAIRSCDWSLLVLHDRPSGFSVPGPMEFLPHFLEWAKNETEIVQAFPPQCLPMRRGARQPWLADFLAKEC